MPYGILVEDFVPLCCYLVEGDVRRSLSSLIDAVYELQARLGSGAHFGTGPHDFEAAIHELVRRNGIENGAPPVPYRGPLALHRTMVCEMIPLMLQYRCVRFDRGSVSWDPLPQGQIHPERLILLEGYFSSQWPPPTQEELMRTLTRLGWTDSMVLTCLRGGGYRETLWQGYLLEQGSE